MCCAGELSGVQSAVVYVGFRYAADALAAQLKRAGINAAAYHAGLAYDQREFVQVSSLYCYQLVHLQLHVRPTAVLHSCLV